MFIGIVTGIDMPTTPPKPAFPEDVWIGPAAGPDCPDLIGDLGLRVSISGVIGTTSLLPPVRVLTPSSQVSCVHLLATIRVSTPSSPAESIGIFPLLSAVCDR